MSKTNESLMQRRTAAVPRGVGQIHPIFADRAENSTVTDVEGREFIDFAGGIAVLNTGHLHPKVVAAVQEQLTKLTHTCFHHAPEPRRGPGPRARARCDRTAAGRRSLSAASSRPQNASSTPASASLTVPPAFLTATRSCAGVCGRAT